MRGRIRLVDTRVGRFGRLTIRDGPIATCSELFTPPIGVIFLPRSVARLRSIVAWRDFWLGCARYFGMRRDRCFF
jgi:hypothetical protein